MIKFAICDDEPLMARELAGFLAGYMEEKSITAYSVSSFAGGRALLESGGFDVIFLDIQMERPDGMETARRMTTCSSPWSAPASIRPWTGFSAPWNRGRLRTS